MKAQGASRQLFAASLPANTTGIVPLRSLRLDRYEVLSQLGRGGMGVVYKARDKKLDRLVALKFLPPEWSRDHGIRASFVREAQAASAIDHPNICTIHDIDSTIDGQLIIVMAHYEGQTLKQKIEHAPLGTPEIIEIATQITAALEAAHARSIVHRDVKPGNIFVCRTGLVKLLDFGLARSASGEQNLQICLDGWDVPGRPIGTPNYMAPERILEMLTDPRSDLFSLGVVMYEMATGQRPFEGSSPVETVMNVLDNEPLPLRCIAPTRPASLGKVIIKALAKNADDRFQTATEIRQALSPIGRKPRSRGLNMVSRSSLNTGGWYDSEPTFWSGRPVCCTVR